ncbi:MAG: carboxylating nicotinate-nucleotide diphosphorylase [Armatimonadota bacterium]|jgi:nicotinate-nucleotide pyrophosphorylase (carboxylating)
MIELDAAYIDRIVRRALDEDIGTGDITTLLTIGPGIMSEAQVVAKAECVIAGMQVAAAAFEKMDAEVDFMPLVKDSERAGRGDVIASVSGPARALLIGERVALNFLQMASGVATLTRRYVDLVSHTEAKIIDTRKTVPGLRRLQKYAVGVGGGFNHRFNLSDGILVKDNHIAAAGSITAAILAVKKNAPHTMKIECEVTTLNQLDEAIAAGADAVLLDNMTVEMLGEAVQLAAGRVITEASGGVIEQSVAAIAETGVDLISVGALTHSAPAIDISLQFK